MKHTRTDSATEIRNVIRAFTTLLNAWKNDRTLRPPTPVGDNAAFEARLEVSKAIGQLDYWINQLADRGL